MLYSILARVGSFGGPTKLSNLAGSLPATAASRGLLGLSCSQAGRAVG
jgi:hypothetical protein